MALDDSGRHALESRGIGDIDAQRFGPMTAAGDVGDAPGGVIAARGRDDRGALFRQAVRGRTPDPARRTGHQRDFPG